MSDSPHTGTAFLTVEEAAERLGMSRLRVREAVARGLIKGRRDNEGRLRVDLPKGGKIGKDAGGELEPDAVLSFLFDDIEELEAALAEKGEQVARLTGLLSRQDAALERADKALDAAEGQKQRLSDLLERALAHLEDSDGRVDHLAQLSGRSLAALESALGRAEAGDAQAMRMAGLLDRAMQLAEAGQGAEATADRALNLLDKALASAEAAQAGAARAEAAAQSVKRALDESTARLTQRDKELDATLALSERAAALAETTIGPRRKGFWRRLLGI